ncbi:hypothetical protein [Trichothermofontia sp.]
MMPALARPLGKRTHIIQLMGYPVLGAIVLLGVSMLMREVTHPAIP